MKFRPRPHHGYMHHAYMPWVRGRGLGGPGSILSKCNDNDKYFKGETRMGGGKVKKGG